MSSFFISLYTDEDVSVLVATLLRSRGYQVLTTQEAGNTGRSDLEQLAFAAARQMTILTHNRDDYLALFNQYLSAGKCTPASSSPCDVPRTRSRGVY